MENDSWQALYIAASVLFVVWQGPLYFKWHPRKYDVCSTEYWKELLLNTTGSIVGWSAGYYLLFFRLFNEGLIKYDPRPSDLVFLLVFFYGANGRLPDILINRVNAVIEKVASKF